MPYTVVIRFKPKIADDMPSTGFHAPTFFNPVAWPKITLEHDSCQGNSYGDDHDLHLQVAAPCPGGPRFRVSLK
jgi:hypothetical protein